MTYLVTWTGVYESVTVRRFDGKFEASAFLAQQPETVNGFALESENDFPIEVSKMAFVRIHNALSDLQINSVSNRAAGAQRLWQVIESKFHNIPVSRPATKEPVIVNLETHEAPHPDHGTVTKTKKELKAEAATAKKTAAAEAKANKPAPEPKGPGVISTIIEFLQSGGGTVDDIFNHLKTVFPDRGDGMLTTVKVQLQALPKRAKDPIVLTKVKQEDGKTHYSA